MLNLKKFKFEESVSIAFKGHGTIWIHFPLTATLNC